MSTPGEVIGSPSSTVGRSSRPTASSVDAGAAHGELKELVEVARHAPLEGEASQQRVLRRVALRHADDPRAEPLEGGVASRPRGEEGGAPGSGDAPGSGGAPGSPSASPTTSVRLSTSPKVWSRTRNTSRRLRMRHLRACRRRTSARSHHQKGVCVCAEECGPRRGLPLRLCRPDRRADYYLAGERTDGDRERALALTKDGRCARDRLYPPHRERGHGTRSSPGWRRL